LTNGQDIARLIDLNGDNLVSLQELREFNHRLRGQNMRLWGMMTPEVVTHSYQILENRWDCSFATRPDQKLCRKALSLFRKKMAVLHGLP